jgi:glycosyltransferase involved in cell wall biosynthesis
MTAKRIGPRISIITPCLNAARYVGEAIESVSMQGHSDAEHIVADGGSTDGTLDILIRHPHLRILSSPDNGMYDALNSALAIAGGEFIGVLNSDDCYADDVFSSVVELFRDESVMAVAGGAVTFRDARNDDQPVMDQPMRAGVDTLFRSTLGDPTINACFFRASVFAKIGRFDASYRIAGDREFMLRFSLSGLRCAETEKVICRYRAHPESLTFGRNEEIWDVVLREHNRMTSLYLHQPGLSKRARDLIRRARTRDTLLAATRSARLFEVRKLMCHAAAGTRHDPVWPARFAKRAVRALALTCGFIDRNRLM